MNVLTIGAITLLSCTTNDPNMNQLLDAIRMVESSDGKNLTGDNGKAIGPYQIWEDYWKDAMRILKKDWPYSDAMKESRAREAVKAYITHYGKGHGWEGMARCHNGGPTGWKKKSTLVYLDKIKTALKEKKK